MNLKCFTVVADDHYRYHQKTFLAFKITLKWFTVETEDHYRYHQRTFLALKIT
jgi:hypothetical protein